MKMGRGLNFRVQAHLRRRMTFQNLGNGSIVKPVEGFGSVNDGNIYFFRRHIYTVVSFSIAMKRK